MSFHRRRHPEPSLYSSYARLYLSSADYGMRISDSHFSSIDNRSSTCVGLAPLTVTLRNFEDKDSICSRI